MRLLFAHDHPFQRGPDGELYTLGSFPASVWGRYLAHFDEIRVVARNGGAAAPDVNLARADRSGVTFDLLPSLASLRQLVAPSPAVRARMEAAVRSADAVVARLPSEIGLFAVRYARQLGKPYAVEVVGCAWDGFVHHGSPIARMYAPLVFQRTRSAVEKAPLALYVTSEWLQRRYPNKAFSASASNVEIVPLDEQGRERREKRLQEIAAGRAPKLGTIATLSVKTKGIQTAIAAIAKLRRNGLDLDYSVLGSGDQRPWKAMAKRFGVADLVTFDGTRESGDGVRQWLDAIDVHLQPSFQEGLPRATIEAMSRGVACIGSRCGGLPELLPESRTHRPGDVDGLADCIRRLVADPEAIAEASRQGLATASDYLPEKLDARRAQIYGRLRAFVSGQPEIADCDAA